MQGGGIGRVLVAALHQGITEQIPSRLEFYENWLTPAGLRNGTIGLAPLVAVLSFLRLEGDPYERVTRRAGDHAASWTVERLGSLRRRLTRALPRGLRARMALRIACRLVRDTCAGSRARVRLRRGAAEVLLRGSLFCAVREPGPHALCGFYAEAFARVLALFDLESEVRTAACRARGDRTCHFTILLPRARRRRAAGASA